MELLLSSYTPSVLQLGKNKLVLLIETVLIEDDFENEC